MGVLKFSLASRDIAIYILMSEDFFSLQESCSGKNESTFFDKIKM